MKKYLLGTMFLLLSFFFARPITEVNTLDKAIAKLNDSTETELCLNFNKSVVAGSDRIGSDGLQTLAVAIGQNKTITNLYLDFCVNWIDDEGARAFAVAIRQNKTITKLTLSLGYNQISDTGAWALGVAIGQNKTITKLTLSLSKNRIGPDGIRSLVNAIRQNTTITGLDLNLSKNRMGVDGVRSLADLIRLNRTIESLGLCISDNQIGDEGARALACAIENNTTVLSRVFRPYNICLGNNQISDEEMQNLKNTVNRVVERNKQFFTFEKNFLELLTTGEFSDVEILGHKVHSTVINIRLGDNAIARLQDVLSGRNKKIVKAFLGWVYSGFVKTDNKNNIKEICDDLRINFEDKNGIVGFRRDIRFLYDSKLMTGDFIINVHGINIGRLVHKVILAARSGLFRGLFSISTDTSDKITDRSGLSLSAMEAFIEFIYTGQISNLGELGSDVRDELLEAAKFYQLPEGIVAVHYGTSMTVLEEYLRTVR